MLIRNTKKPTANIPSMVKDPNGKPARLSNLTLYSAESYRQCNKVRKAYGSERKLFLYADDMIIIWKIPRSYKITKFLKIAI